MKWRLTLQGAADRSGEPSLYVQGFTMEFEEPVGDHYERLAMVVGNYFPCGLMVNEGQNLFEVADAYSQQMYEVVRDVTGQSTYSGEPPENGYFRDDIDLACPVGDLVCITSIDWRGKESFFAGEDNKQRCSVISELCACFPHASLVAMMPETVVEKYSPEDLTMLGVGRLVGSTLFIADPNKVSQFDKEVRAS